MRAKYDKNKRIARIEFMLKYINKMANDLAPNDLEWSIRMEEAYKNKGDLTYKQVGILESIYGRY